MLDRINLKRELLLKTEHPFLVSKVEATKFDKKQAFLHESVVLKADTSFFSRVQ